MAGDADGLTRRRYDRVMRTLRAAVVLLLFATHAVAQPTSRPATRVACVGDSITFGVGVRDRKADAYPSVLQRLLGDGYEVRNFGASGATALAHSNRPYVERPQFKAAQAYQPDVVVVMLGANDSKHPAAATTRPGEVPDNWSRRADFVKDYRAILAAFRAANADVKLYAATPVPAYPPSLGGIDPAAIRDEIVPKVREAAQAEGATVIDLHAALSGQGEKFPDHVHPNEAGARAMAEAVHAALRAAPTTRPVEGVTP